MGRVCPGHPPNSRTPCSSHSICSNGTWSCQQSAHCPSTCSLYGEGHVVTFDGQRFVFDGNCEYILVTVSAHQATGPMWGWGPRGRLLNTPSPQDGCNASDSQPTFKILTENVVCAKSGATCSRAIKILLGVSKRAASPTATGPRAWPLRMLADLCPDLHIHTMLAVSPRTGQRCSGEGSPPSLTLSPQQIPGCPGAFSQEGSRGQAPRPGGGSPTALSCCPERRQQLTAAPPRACPSCWQTPTTR